MSEFTTPKTHAQQTAHHAQQAAQDTADQARQRLQETFDQVAEDPKRTSVAAGAAGFVLGLLVAGLVRRRVTCDCYCDGHD